jgi:bifunctional non-homologous end joining protein LigD
MVRRAGSAKLARYRSKRDFSRTAEPHGDGEPQASGHRFVVQQHAARRMHYDFRLELDGVLLSWSVPKGPSLSPRVRRLAVRTEDHPLDYAEFEGAIPQGEYGGGAVVVWDLGEWVPEPGAGDPAEAVARGKLSFTLHGEKLRGRWHLVRTRPQGKAENWLLFKARDEAARDDVDIVATEPASVLSGRTVDQVAAAPDRVWHSDRAAANASDKRAAPARAARPRRSTGAPAPPGPPAAALVEQLPLGFKLSNLEKVLYPDQGITKADLVAYLAAVSEWALPHIAHRPLMILRCPDGIAARAPRGRACFFQKHALAGSPPAIGSVPDVDHAGHRVEYMQIHDMPGLVALAQLGSLEIHTWGARADQLDQPDLLVFDLDPDPSVGWDQVALGALELRRRLREAGLDSFVKTTGGKGLHVVAPIARGPSWDELKAFSHAIASAIERDQPALYTTNMAKARRAGKIYLDYLRNGRGATFIAPYSPRARPGAPVAVPISWDELTAGVDPGAFTIASVPRRLAGLADPWAGIATLRQALAGGPSAPASRARVARRRSAGRAPHRRR